jgi:transposase
MPKLCHARAPTDPVEAAQIRKLAHSYHAPYDCKQRAQMIALSWEGLRTGEIACHLRCHPQTVRERFERFNAEGVEGLTNRPGAGRKARLTEQKRSQLIALVAQTPPGRPVRQADGQLMADDPTEPTQWSLDALVSAAHQQGIAIKRSQVRRILLKEKVRWRQVRSWAVSQDPDFVPKGRRSSKPTRTRKLARRPSA